MAGTFGRDGVTPSYSRFAVPESMHDVLAYHINVSFLVRTHRQSGILFYIGTDPSAAGSNKTFITIELSEVGIVSRVKLGDEVQTNVLPASVADGLQHIVHLFRNYSLLQLQVDNTLKVFSINFSVPLVPDVLYLGWIPSESHRRRRRQIDSLPNNQFSGTMQDFWLNDLRLQPVNHTSQDGTLAPVVELPVDTLNVDVSEQSDNMCLDMPCENNATCQTEFYNKFRLLMSPFCCYSRVAHN